MRSLSRILVLPALASLPLLALADAPDPVADARQQVQKLRVIDPQHYARLRHNLAVFIALPPTRQEALRKLDRDLQEEPPPQRARLERVMDRYADWLERLPEAERKNVLAAPDRASRVQRIRAIREQQWVKRLPKAKADKLAKLPEAQRAETIKKWRHEEIEERLDWLAAQRHWDGLARNTQLPNRPEQLDDASREALEKTLRPLLNPEELKQLKEAEGKWPRYPRVLIDLADNHPLSVQGPIGPTSFKELTGLNPLAVTILENDKKYKATRERLKESEGKWPEYGAALKELSRLQLSKKGPLLPPHLTPAHSDAFPALVQQFLEKRLVPALDEEESARLKKAQGRWPDYPQTILELSHKHNLPIPAGKVRFETLERYRWRYLTNPAAGPGRRSEPFWVIP
jgi:hypothetical protein